MLRTAALNKLSYADALKKNKSEQHEPQTMPVKPTKTADTTTTAQLSAQTVQKLKDDIMREAVAIMDESLRKLKDDLMEEMRSIRGQHHSDMDFALEQLISSSKGALHLIDITMHGKTTSTTATSFREGIKTSISAAIQGRTLAKKELAALGFNNTSSDEEAPPDDEE